MADACAWNEDLIDQLRVKSSGSLYLSVLVT